MIYLLDTNICIYIMKKKSPQICARFEYCDPDDICISTITEGEIYYGIAKDNPGPQKIEAWGEFLSQIHILPFDSVAASVYGKIRAKLELAGMGIGPLDMLIASQAVAYNLILVSNNIREFGRVEGLRYENWV